MDKQEATIIIAEDKNVWRFGLRQIVSQLGHCRIIGESHTAQGTIELVAEKSPSIVLLKRDLPDTGGIRVCQQIRRRHPETKVIMMLSQEQDIWASLESGADGYILRESPDQLLMDAIDAVRSGLNWIGPFISTYLLKGDGLALMRTIAAERDELPGLGKLTSRERDVLRLVINGQSNQQIADGLQLQLETTKVHVRSIFRKLEVNSRSELTSKVLKTGLPV